MAFGWACQALPWHTPLTPPPPCLSPPNKQGQYLGNSARVSASMHGTFSELWREVAGDDVHAATTFCNEYRSLEACVAPFADHDPASGVGRSLALESAAIGVVPCPYQDEWRRGDVTDPKAQAKVSVQTCADNKMVQIKPSKRGWRSMNLLVPPCVFCSSFECATSCLAIRSTQPPPFHRVFN